MSTLSTLEANSLKGALEALLLVSSDPVSAPALAGALDIAPGECASLLAELKVEYEEANRGFQLREVAGGWRLFTHPAYHDVVESYVLSWDTQKLSQAALETLAVIAYHQPVTREVVKGIRGVNSDGVIASLVDKGLVRELGRDPQRGQAIIYGTTNAFLEKFGLRSTRDLPDLEQFAPDEQSRQFIRERLSGRSIQSTLEEQVEDLDEERELLRAWGYPVWNLPAGACLATRVPTGEELTHEKVDLIRACEDYLHDLGLAQVRARLVGGCMRIEAAHADVAKIAALGGATVNAEGKTPLPAAIESALRELGCGHISPEVTPYIHGNMNQ